MNENTFSISAAGRHSDALSPACPESITRQSDAASPAQPSGIPDLAVARAAFALLARLEGQSRRKPPSLLAVFRLYCMQNMTVYQIARQYRCSVGTVSQRLKLIRHQTGRPPKSLPDRLATPQT